MRTGVWCVLLCLLFICSLPTSGYAQDEVDASFLVHARMYSLFSYTPEPVGMDAAVIVERIRPNLELSLGELARLEVAWDLVPIVGTVGTQSTGFAIQTQNVLRLVDFDAVLHDPKSKTWLLQHNFDRMSMAFFTEAFELRLGRQALSHGSARMFPASDIFGPFGPGTIDTEFKRGIDAARLTVPVGDMHEAEIYAVANSTNVRDWMLIARWRSSIENVMDLSFYGGVSYRRPTVALDLSGDVFGAAWYVDAFARFALEDEDVHAIRASAGLDYQWSFGLRTILEAHYNGLGSEPDFSSLLTTPSIERQVGEVFFLGKWYLGASLGYGFTPLLNGTLGYIQSLTDGSGLMTVAMGYDFAQEVTLGLGALVPVGSRPREVAPGILQPQSEFGLYPVVGFTDLRFVF